jgi:hypothetical protein
VAAAGQQSAKLMSVTVAEPVFANLESLDGPRFLVTVDTEEEFDWHGPFTRDQHGTTHVAAIDRFQTMCDVHGVKPAYLIDYPIAEDTKAANLLGGYAAEGKAAIGMQLHPWVNPPFLEELSVYNSFACNLPPELEWEKLSKLHAKIVERLGVYPDIYRAGRYGAGEQTPHMLVELGVAIDSSVRTNFDYSAENGPNYSAAPLNPYWLHHNTLLELPVTTVFNGGLRNFGAKIYGDLMSSQASRSVLSRTRLLERIALTPEGIPLAKAIEGIDCALAQNVGILNFSFHSPSLAPGHTNYVKTVEDLERLYNWWHCVFAHLAIRGVKPIEIDQIKATLFSRNSDA